MLIHQIHFTHSHVFEDIAFTITLLFQLIYKHVHPCRYLCICKGMLMSVTGENHRLYGVCHELMIFMFSALPSSVPSLLPQPPKKSRFRASRDKDIRDPELASHSALDKPGLPDIDPEEMLDSELELSSERVL